MRAGLFLVALCVLLVALSWSGCVETTPKRDEPIPEETKPFITQECEPQSGGPLLDIELEPASLGVGRHKLTIFAKNPDSNLFVEVQPLTVEPWMPVHGHGAPEPPKVTRVFKGKYEIYPVHFSMPGTWQLKISATTAQGKTVLCEQVKVADKVIKDGPDTPKRIIPTDVSPPLLEHAVVSLEGSFNAKTKTLGSLLCDKSSTKAPCFVPFLRGTGDSYEQAGFWTFNTAPGTLVRAASGGVVESTQFMYHSHTTHSDMFRLTTRMNKDNAFSIEYRNVKGLQVKVGDVIKPGQVLGEAGDAGDAQHTKVSFGVKRFDYIQQRMCPTNYLSKALESLFAKTMAALQSGGVMPPKSVLCGSRALACQLDVCEKPASFVAVKGDVDAGRRGYKGACASCHGSKGEGGIGTDLCQGDTCKCITCQQTHDILSRRIALDMPPEGRCIDTCADNVSAYILFMFK